VDIERADASGLTEGSRRIYQGSRAAVSTILAIITIDLIAIILSPSSDIRLFESRSGRAYLIIVLACAVALFLWGKWSHNPDVIPFETMASASILITLAPALFLVGRVSLLPIVLTLSLAAAIAIVGGPSPMQPDHGGMDLSWAAVLASSWFGIVGVSSLDVEGRYQYPFIAMISAAAAVSLSGRSNHPSRNITLPTLAAVIGVEISISVSFLKISPYVEASLWSIGLLLVASTYSLIRKSYE
jgi:hypothetical protein